MVVRGSVRVVGRHSYGPGRFRCPRHTAHAKVVGWRTVRASLEKRRESRRAELRFRRHPDAYLGRLEEQLLKRALPS